jgi:hypothetical protein
LKSANSTTKLRASFFFYLRPRLSLSLSFSAVLSFFRFSFALFRSPLFSPFRKETKKKNKSLYPLILKLSHVSFPFRAAPRKARRAGREKKKEKEVEFLFFLDRLNFSQKRVGPPPAAAAYLSGSFFASRGSSKQSLAFLGLKRIIEPPTPSPRREAQEEKTRMRRKNLAAAAKPKLGSRRPWLAFPCFSIPKTPVGDV